MKYIDKIITVPNSEYGFYSGRPITFSSFTYDSVMFIEDNVDCGFKDGCRIHLIGGGLVYSIYPKNKVLRLIEKKHNQCERT